MELQEINYVYSGFKYKATVHLLSPLTWIVLVDSIHFEPFHLEFDEMRRKWAAIEDISDKKLVSAIGSELIKLYYKDIERTVFSSKFSSLEYFVVDNGREDIICFWDNELRIRVATLTGSPLFEGANELLYYGDDFGTPIVFQTIDYHGEGEEFILKAIKWYAEYLEYPQMVISKENPLSDFKF